MKTVEQIAAEVWPGWKLESLIGAGAYGEVYKASREDIAGTSSAAIKVMKIYRQGLQLQGTEKETADVEMQRLLERFSAEIRLMQSLKGQTNLVSIDDYQVTEDKENGILYILIRMELLTPLLVDLEVHGTAEDRIRKLGIDLCRGLEVCGNARVVHRDIKPENIFVNRFGNYKLGDFSVARTMDLTREAFTSRDDAQMERFAAPEVKNGQLRQASFEEACKADIYSLGMVLYWAANGQQSPFLPEKTLYTNHDREEAENRRLAGEPLPELQGISPALQEVIRKACAFDPDKRYASAAAFREALEQNRKTDGAAEKKNTKRKMTGRKHGWILPAAMAGLVLLCALWLLIPVRIPVRYLGPAGQEVHSETFALRPGTTLEIPPQGDGLPDGYETAETEPLRLSVDLLRRSEPEKAEIHCRVKETEAAPDTLMLSEISYPHVYCIGVPFAFGGEIVSEAELTGITINLYTMDTSYSQQIELEPGTKRYLMRDAGDQLFYHLDEGPFWLEIIASDAAGRRMGFSHKSKASYLEENHTIYTISRSYGPPELRASFMYNDHTYEVYRLPGGGWNLCNAYAQGKGGHLVTFTDEDEFSVVTSFCLGMGVKYINIGAQYSEGAWHWMDGSPFSNVNWKPEMGDMPFAAYSPVGAAVYTSSQQWYMSQATQYEISYFIMEYEDFVH